jgi:hypothetical protein
MKNKIGLGIITFNSPEKIKQSAFSVTGVDEFVIINDGRPYSPDCYPSSATVIQHEENMKVARSKNDALKYLMDKNCEHLFLMEDDVIIKDPTVFKKYIETSSITGIRHLNFALQGPYNFKTKGPEEEKEAGLNARIFNESEAIPNPLLLINYDKDHSIALYKACVGAFSYFHRSVIEKSGYFDEFFKNSWEHVEHTYRIIRDGFHPSFGWFADIKDSNDYLSNIENCMEHSSIAKDPQWKVNSDAGEKYFKDKYGYKPTKIYSSRDEAIDSLKNIYVHRDLTLLIKFPTRGRKEKFFSVLDQYIEFLEDKENYSIIVSCDVDDTTMNQAEVIERLKNYKNLKYFFGNNKCKIEAVNGDISEDEKFDIVLLASDDMIPVKKGYDEVIRKNMRQHFPDMDGILWFNDGYQENRLNTLCILGKEYYKRFKYIYNTEYKSLWCDNEFMHVGNMLKKQKYFSEIIIRHEHPASHKNIEEDESYQLNLKYDSIDWTTYSKRKKENFNLNKYSILIERFKSFFYKNKFLPFTISYSNDQNKK